MPIGHEEVLKSYTAHTAQQVVDLLSQALSELPDALVILSSEDTVQRFLQAYTELKNPAQTFERVKSEHKLMGKPFAFEEDARGCFIVTSLTQCIRVRYAPE